MGYSEADAAHDAADAERAESALQEAEEAARRIAREFEGNWQGDRLHPNVSVELAVGGDDQPVFVFRLLVDLDEDLDADEYPADEIAGLQGDLRNRVPGTPVDAWDWIVTTGTKAGSAA